MVSETINGKTREVVFGDWSSLLDYIAKPVEDSPAERTARKREKADFDGNTDWASSVLLATSGWPEGAAKTKAISEPIFERIGQLIERQDIVHDVEGMGIDVARYLDGEPECWQRWESHIVAGPGVKIIKMAYNFCASWVISAETITARGAMVTALVELFEYAGNRVELWAVFSSQGKQDYLDNMRVLVKSADQHLDMPRIAFALSHPAMLRRIQFEVMEHMPKSRWDKFGDSRGHTGELNCADYDIYLPAMSGGDYQWQNPSAAVQWAIQNLEKQGILLKKVEEPI